MCIGILTGFNTRQTYDPLTPEFLIVNELAGEKWWGGGGRYGGPLHCEGQSCALQDI